MKNRAEIYKKRILDAIAQSNGEVYLFEDAVAVAFTKEEWEALLAENSHVSVRLLSEEELLAMDAAAEEETE